MSHYATVAINIYLASNLKMILKKAHKVCKILRLQFRLQYARWYGLYRNAMAETLIKSCAQEITEIVVAEIREENLKVYQCQITLLNQEYMIF